MDRNVHVCAHEYMNEDAHTHVHISIYIYTCLHQCMYIDAGIHLYLHACIYACIHNNTCVHIYMYLMTHRCAQHGRVHAYICTHMHTYASMKMRMRTHTHICIYICAYTNNHICTCICTYGAGRVMCILWCLCWVLSCACVACNMGVNGWARDVWLCMAMSRSMYTQILWVHIDKFVRGYMYISMPSLIGSGRGMGTAATHDGANAHVCVHSPFCLTFHLSPEVSAESHASQAARGCWLAMAKPIVSHSRRAPGASATKRQMMEHIHVEFCVYVYLLQARAGYLHNLAICLSPSICT